MDRNMAKSWGASMGRALNRLSDVAVRAKRRPGYVADGGNLYLCVAPGGTKGWIFRFHGRQNTRRWAGLLPCREPRQGAGGGGEVPVIGGARPRLARSMGLEGASVSPRPQS